MTPRILLLPLVLALLAIPLACDTQAWSSSAVVRFDPNATIGDFPAALLGNNLQWTDNGDGLLPAGADAFVPQAVAVLRTLPVPVLRFPGGYLSSSYDWRAGVGDPAKRGSGSNFSGQPERMRFGTGEFLDLCRQLGAAHMITVNVTRPPEEAAAWLEFVTGRGAGSGLWEVGNESYLPQDPSHMTAAEYVARFKAISQALKRADAGAKVGAILEGTLIGTAWGKLVVPEIATWNETVVAGTGDLADFYTVHLYAPMSRGKTELDTRRAVMAGPAALEENLRAVRKLIDSRAPGKPLWVTEYNVGIDDAKANWVFGTGQAQAVYVTGMLSAFARQRVAGANYWSLIGNHNFGIIRSAADPRPRPSGLLFRLLAPLAGGQALPTQVEASTLDVPEVGNVPAGMKAPVLDALVLRKDGKSFALVCNRDAERELTVTFEVLGGGTAAFAGGSLLTRSNGAPSADGLDHGDTVEVVPLGPAKTLKLPPASVALVEVQ